jgi:excinuclease UvrABC helicase subunit UvrB
VVRKVPRITAFAKIHYTVPLEAILNTIEQIKEKLTLHLFCLQENSKLLKAQHLK